MENQQINKGRRKFLLAATSILGGIGALFASVPFISSWWPSARTQALGSPVTVDISHLEPGAIMTVVWRGKPIWIVHRTPAMLATLKTDTNLLRDPDSKVDQQPNYADNEYRSIKPEYLILVGICTHLGCIPNYKPQLHQLGPTWPGGFYCPCHGSMYDLAGRVFKNVPAPINLQVPPYHFLNDTTIIIGEGAHA
jgi:ubiquinol-cytochrome c reductase iron-sulfur subunit